MKLVGVSVGCPVVSGSGNSFRACNWSSVQSVCLRHAKRVHGRTRRVEGGVKLPSRREYGRLNFVVSATGSTEVQESVKSPQSAKELKAVLFDMDGVLVDSEELSAKAAVETFKQVYGVETTVDDFYPFRGMGEIAYLGNVAKKYNIEYDIAALKSAFYDIFGSKFAVPDADIGYAGGLDLIQACKSAGFKVALASSADRVKVEASLIAAKIPINIFDAVVTGNDDIKQLKPSPEIFLKAASKLDVSPMECAVIEDSVPGVQAAKAAGAVCLGVLTSVPASTLVEQGPAAMFSSIAAISVDTLKNTYEGQTEDKAPQAEVGFLEKEVALPGGYTTTRRELLKFANLGLASGTLYIAFSRAKAMSFASPKGLLNYFKPFGGMGQDMDSGSSRVDAFKRFIADLERKGGGEIVGPFPQGLDWFNSPPLTFNRELKGKIVVLDFWTYCCINCMHVLPDLAAVEQTFEGKPVSVVGVHSAKFDNEKDSGAIRSAVLRYGISHPVVNDGNMIMWRDLGVSSWPTLAVLGPRGNLLFMLTGEGHRQDLDDLITAALEFYGKRQELDYSPVPQALERDKKTVQSESPLRFPGKVTTDLAGDRLFISDSNNHRIVITTLNGQYLKQVGGNSARLVDGSFEESAFNRPQGMAYDPIKDVLYVADTENHALREVNLKDRTVRTVAGNGFQGRDYKGGAKGVNQQLSSPWAVELDAQNRFVYVALAGQHQIWRYDPVSGITGAFSGNGYERNKNGDNQANTSWAQPSGLSLSGDGRFMFVADSESSSIRKVDLESGGGKPCVGGDPLFADNLFRYGDRDGSGSGVLLQHPLGVCALDDGQVFVADSYNHKIKVLNSETNTISSVVGTGVAGYSDGVGQQGTLSEPGGLAKGRNGTLLIADTNNNLIRVLDPRKKSVTTLELKNVPPPRMSPLDAMNDAVDAPPIGKVVRADPIETTNGQINIAVNFTPGYHYTEGAKSQFTSRVVDTSSSSITLSPASGLLKDGNGPAAVINYSIDNASQITGTEKIQIDARIYFCKEKEACLFEEVRFEVPVGKSVVDGTSTVTVETSPSISAPVVDLNMQ